MSRRPHARKGVAPPAVPTARTAPAQHLISLPPSADTPAAITVRLTAGQIPVVLNAEDRAAFLEARGPGYQTPVHFLAPLRAEKFVHFEGFKIAMLIKILRENFRPIGGGSSTDPDLY